MGMRMSGETLRYPRIVNPQGGVAAVKTYGIYEEKPKYTPVKTVAYSFKR
jgi:hypothetical protein